MKLQNNFLLIVIAAIGVYAAFLFISDYNSISEKISFFQLEYLLPILSLVSVSWIPLILRWNILLKQNGNKPASFFLDGSYSDPNIIDALYNVQDLYDASFKSSLLFNLTDRTSLDGGELYSVICFCISMKICFSAFSLK